MVNTISGEHTKPRFGEIEKGHSMITGIRPTGALTLANYLGAVKPLLENAKPGTAIFVADLHALTDNEPGVVAKYRREVVKDYLALGVDPEIFYVYLQSSIGGITTQCASYLSRLVTVAELLRVPTLKDKLKSTSAPETANAALLEYPVLMAADIFLQDSDMVPVGDDQVAHLEVARELARRFNKRYGQTLKEPRPLALKACRILSLKGEGKMSKSNPPGAIFLTDSADVIRKKIRTAETANPGEMSDKVESLNLIASVLSVHDSAEAEAYQAILQRHRAGDKVMAEFKEKLAETVVAVVAGFQDRRRGLTDSGVDEILRAGAKIAEAKAQSVLSRMELAMGFERFV